MQDETEIYEAVGGDQPFYDLVEEFYALVERDSPLRSLYPEDLGPGKQHLAWFLIQRFGGPEHFNQSRGAPKLRMRHVEFAVTHAMRDAWLRHMLTAVDSLPVFGPYRDAMRDYFENAATFLINREEPSANRVRLDTL